MMSENSARLALKPVECALAMLSPITPSACPCAIKPDTPVYKDANKLIRASLLKTASVIPRFAWRASLSGPALIYILLQNNRAIYICKNILLHHISIHSCHYRSVLYVYNKSILSLE